MLGFIAVLLIAFLGLYFLKTNSGFVAFALLFWPMKDSFCQLSFIHMIITLAIFCLCLGYVNTESQDSTWEDSLSFAALGCFIMFFVSLGNLSIVGWFVVYSLIAVLINKMPSEN